MSYSQNRNSELTRQSEFHMVQSKWKFDIFNFILRVMLIIHFSLKGDF